MTRWTISKEVTLHYHPKIDSGVSGHFAWVDLTSQPTTEFDKLEIIFQLEVDPDSAQWIEFVLSGFKEYENLRASEGRPIGGVRLTVDRIYWHVIDTSPTSVKRTSRDALQALFVQNETSVDSESSNAISQDI